MFKMNYLLLSSIIVLLFGGAITAQNVPTTLEEMVGSDKVELQYVSSLEKTTLGGWMQGASMPHPRYYGGSVMYTRNDTSWLYVLGGDTTGGGVATATCLKYNVITDTWEYIAPLPEPLRTNAAAILGDKIYTMGGFNAPFPAPAVTSFYEYDINTDSWTTLPDIPSPLFFHGAIGYEDSLIYIIGGIEDVPNQDGDLFSVKVRLFNRNDQSFRDATDLPEATASFAYALIVITSTFSFYLASGLKSTTELSNHTQIGEIDQNDRAIIKYSFGENYPLAVYAHYGAPLPNGEIYYIGGSNTTGFSPVNTGIKYDASMGTYKTWLNSPVAVMAFSAGGNYSPEMQEVLTEIKLVIAGGIIPGPSVSNQCWIFTDTVDVVGINKIEETVPDEYSLLQNYPNPFNPSTKIEYSIPEASFVQLKVYDILGNEVAELVNEEQSAGVYRADFSSNGLASGLYFARLTAANYTQTIKMSLLK